MHYVWGKAGQGEGDWHWDGRVQSVKLHQVLKKNSLDVDRWIEMDGWMDGY